MFKLEPDFANLTEKQQRWGKDSKESQIDMAELRNNVIQNHENSIKNKWVSSDNDRKKSYGVEK